MYLGLYNLLLQGITVDQLGQACAFFPSTWINLEIACRHYFLRDSPHSHTICAPAILQMSAVYRQTSRWPNISDTTSRYLIPFLYCCSNCCYAVPLLTGPSNVLNKTTTLLRAWSGEHPEVQQHLQQCLRHRLFSLVTWGSLVSLVVSLQHEYEGKSRLLGCEVPSATAVVAAAVAGTGILSGSAAAAIDSTLTGMKLVCLGYTAAPEVLAYDMASLEDATLTCLSYTYVCEPLDRLLQHMAQQPKASYACRTSSSSSDGDSSSGGASGSNTSSSSPLGMGALFGVNSNSSSGDPARAVPAAAETSTAAADAAATGKGAPGNPSKEASKGAWGFKKGFFSSSSSVATTAVGSDSWLIEGLVAFEAEVPEKLDIGKLPKSPEVVRQVVECLFVPGREDLARLCMEAAAASDGREAVEADGAVAAGPAAPTAQHLGLVLELLLLACPGGTAGDAKLRIEQLGGQEGARDGEEVVDRNQQQQGNQAGREQEEEKQSPQVQQQQPRKEDGLSRDALRWQKTVDWLLLFGMLLQQATSEAKQQFMMQQGSLMMQLMYRLLLEDASLEGNGQTDAFLFAGPWGVLSSEDRKAAASQIQEVYLAPYPMRKLVLLVLQGLAYEPMVWSDTIAGVVKEAKALYCSIGK